MTYYPFLETSSQCNITEAQIIFHEKDVENLSRLFVAAVARQLLSRRFHSFNLDVKSSALNSVSPRSRNKNHPILAGLENVVVSLFHHNGLHKILQNLNFHFHYPNF